jgi:POT family proton-dependent oligopeptide transporter
MARDERPLRMTILAEPPASPALFGHPRGLAFLFATEMWERFSYYGMRALLVLYMVKYLFLPERADSVIGYAALKTALESLFGPLGVQPFASHVYGLYTALVYLTPTLGGYLADRLLGQRRMIMIGAGLMAIGHFLMASEAWMLVALLLLIAGNGAFKPNISTQVGHLYAAGDSRRDRAFSIFYVGINVGAFFSPLVCGTLAVAFGWHYGFAAAGIGMLIGLMIYAAATPSLPRDALAAWDAAPLTAGERRGLTGLVVLFLPMTLFWATYEQQGNTIALWADDYTRRNVDLVVWSGEIPAEWFQSFNPFMIFAFTPLIVALWASQSRRRSEPVTVTKMAIGCFGVALANVLMVGAGIAASGGERVSAWWLTGYFVLVTLGELYLSPTSLSVVTKVAPTRLRSTVMGLSFGTIFVGAFLAGWLGSFWSGMSKPGFFLMIALIAAGAGIAMLALKRALTTAISG